MYVHRHCLYYLEPLQSSSNDRDDPKDDMELALKSKTELIACVFRNGELSAA